MDLAGMKRRKLQALCKRHGLSAGGSNADLVARLDAALSEATGAAAEEEAGVVARKRKGCLKQTGGDAADAKKVTFAAEEGKARRLRSRVIWSPIVAKTRGNSAQATSDSAAAEDSISAEAGKNVPVRRSRRNSVSAAEAEEIAEVVAVGRKRKRKNQENDESVAVSAQVGVSHRVTRRSSMAVAAVVSPPAVEKKRGRGKTAGDSNKPVAEAPDVQNSAQVEISARISRSRATAPVVMSPMVVENKRRKTIDARTNVELPTVSAVPKNDAPATRSLRSRAVQVNNSMVDETHTARQLENKTQPSRRPTRRHQQVSSSAEDKNQEQIAAPNMAPLLRRSGRNHSEDAEKQPAVKEPVKRSTRKSVVLATLEKEENDLIEEKNPAAHVRRSTRKSIVPVKGIEGIGEEIQNANSEDVAKQPATKGPVRGSRRKSVVSELHEKEKGLIAENGRSMRKSVMLVKDIKAVGERIQNAKGKDVEKQFVVKQPTRRSSRKSVVPVMLENNSGLLAAEMNAQMNVMRSTRKSVVPNMLNVENQDHNKMSRMENFHSGKCHDDERQQKVKEPIRRSRRSVAAVLLDKQSNGLHEEKISKNPMRRSTRKSVALNEVEMVSLDHTEIVAREPERVGEEDLKLRKHRRSSLEISSSANDSWREKQNTQIPNEKDNTGGTQLTSDSTSSKQRSSKRRRTNASEEAMSVKEANDDIRDATKDSHKATHEYNKESSSEVQEICQVNATREEFYSGPLLATVALTDEISIAQSVPVVIPGSESGDNANESSDKSKQPHEHSDTQAVDSHLSETRSGKLDQSTFIAGLVPHNCVVSEDKALMSQDGLSIDFTVGYCEEQSPVSGEERVGSEAIASEPGEKNLANVMSTGLHAKSLQHDIDIIAEEADKAVLPTAFPIEEHGEKYAVSPVAVVKSVGWEASACESAENPLTGIFSNDLHTKHLQHDCDVLTKETGEASGASPPISESVTNPEIQCNAEESIGAADLGKCPSLGSKGNPYPTSLHLEGAADDCILPVLNADKGCSSDERPSSFGLDLMFAETCKESYSKNIENTAVEIVGGNKPSTPVTPGFYAGSVCLGDEDVQPSGFDADKNLDVDQGAAGEENTAVEIDCGNKTSTPVAPGFYMGSDCLEDGPEEVLDQEKCNDQHVPAKTDLNVKINDELAGPGTESGRSIIEKNTRLVADDLDEQAIILVQHGDVEEATSLPEGIGGGNKPSTPITPDFFVGSNCMEDEDAQPTGFDADKKLDVDLGVGDEEVLTQQKSNDQHVPTKTDLNMKLNNELASPCTESGCRITEKNARLFADNLDQQAIFQVQQGDVLEGDLKKPSPCSTTPECKHKYGLPEETVLLPQNTGFLLCSDQSPFGLESLFSQENIDESMGSATAHSKSGFDDSKDFHVKSALENTHVPEPYSLDIVEGISKNDDCMQTSQQDNGMEEANLDGERVLSVFSLDAKLMKEVINFEEVACEDEGSKKLVHSGELKVSSEKTNVNGPDGNAYGIIGAVLSSSLHTPANDNYEICLGSNTDMLHQGHHDQCRDDTEGIIDDSSAKYIERGIVLLSDAIENPSVGLATTGYKHEGALSEEAVHTLKNYAGTCSSNPRELLMDLQSQFSKGSIKESNPHDGRAFSGAENSGDESTNVEQQVKVRHGSDLSHVGSTELLDELIGCSNAEVLHQSHNHEDRSNVDRVEQVASEPCTNDVVEAAAAAECIESGLVLLPSEERSNLNDGQLNPKLESPTNMEFGLNCDKYVCNTSANGSVVVVVGERTPSGSGLPEDYPKDQYPRRQELLDGCSVESSLQGTIFRKKIVSAVAGIGRASSSLATPDYKYEDALSKEAVCRMKNCTGTSLVDPKHLIMELQSLHSEGSTEKPDLQGNLAFTCAESARDEPVAWHVEKLLDTHVSSEPDTYQRPCEDLSRHEEKESCMKGSLTSVQIDLADDAHLIERDIDATGEVLCEEKVERKCMLTSDSDILQEKSYSNGRGICQSPRQKHIVEANSRLSSCGTGTKVLHQDHKEECNEHNEGKFSPKALVENNTSEDAPVGLESSIMLPLVAGMSEIPDKQLNTMMSDESEELSFSCDKDTIENFCTGPAKGDLNLLPKDFHIDTCQKQEVPEVLSLPKSPEESAKFQCVRVSGSGPCQQRANESTSMQATYNIETVNQDHEEYNQNNEDQTTPGISASSVPEAVEIEIEQSEMEIGLIPVTETSVLAIPDEQPNSKLEGNEDQITLGIPASSVLKDAEIEQSEMEIGLIPAAETSVLPVPDEQSNSKLEGKEVDEHSCSYDKDFFILSDGESLKREASSLHKDDCMDLSSEGNHPNDLPAPRSPEPSAYFQNDNDSVSAGICQSSRRRGITELRAKLQSFKVSSTVKGSYIGMSAPRLKPGDSMSQSAIALLRNIENTAAVKTGHPVKPSADGKDSSRRALQPISGRPKEQ